MPEKCRVFIIINTLLHQVGISLQYVILLFHCNNGCTNAPHRYVKRILPVLFISILTVEIFFILPHKLYRTCWRNIKYLSCPKNQIFPSAFMSTGWMRISRPNLQKVNLHLNTRNNITAHTTSEAWLPSFPGATRPGHGVSHSPPSSAEVKMNGAIALFHLYAFKAWTGTLLLPLCFIKKCLHCSINFTRGADKSLTRPGNKQAISTKLGIYLTYSHEAQYTS